MFDSNARLDGAPDKEFEKVLGTAAKTIRQRLDSYTGTDRIQLERLKLLYEVVRQEEEKIANGRIDSYSSLAGPIRAALTWGEPPDSKLVSDLKEAQLYFYNNYWLSNGQNPQTIH
jgi:hypothetical protein